MKSFYEKQLAIVYTLIIDLGYYVLLISDMGNYYHGGTVFGSMISSTILVLSVYAIFKLNKIISNRYLKFLLIVLSVPIIIAIVFMLYFSIK